MEVITEVVNPFTPQAADVLVELAWEEGFPRQQVAYAFGRVPEFSLLRDGRACYLGPSEYDKAQVMAAVLNPVETEALLQSLLKLGIERLESYTDECGTHPGDGCVEDGRLSVLRVRLPGGEQREIRNYHTFANDPEALAAIRALLVEYLHPQAERYTPERAALFVRPLPPSSALPSLDWPLGPAWLAGSAPDATCVRVLAGGELRELLAATGRNLGDFRFRTAESNRVHDVYLVPWLPGVDYTDLVASSGQACPDEGQASRPVESQAPAVPSASRTLADSAWELTSLREQPLLVGTRITLHFEGDRFSSFAGCNTLSGTYAVSGAGLLSFPELALTMELCPEPEGVMDQEKAYVAALVSSAAHRLSEDRLELQDAAGNTVLVCNRQP